MRLILFILTSAFFAAGAQAGDWHMLGHDAAHTGDAGETVEPSLELLWKYTIDSGTRDSIFSSPAVSGGTVYTGTTAGNVYALDAVTGELRWKYKTDGSIYSTPAVSAGMVYAASDEYLYSLDMNTGDLKWKYQIRTISSPAAYNGTIYTLSDGYVYALEAKTGNLKWKYTLSAGSYYASPAVHDGSVYIGSGTALDAETGSLKWDSSNGSATSSAVISGDVVYGIYSSWATGEGYGNYLAALDVNTGDLKWKHQIGNVNSYFLPAVSGGTVYAGLEDGYLHALDANTGSLKWKYRAVSGRKGQASTPSVSGNTVYVMSIDPYSDNELHALNANTGELVWKYMPDASSYSQSSPVVSWGVVYFASGNSVYALAPPSYFSLKDAWKAVRAAGTLGVNVTRELEILSLADSAFKKGEQARAYDLAENATTSIERIKSDYAAGDYGRAKELGAQAHSMAADADGIPGYEDFLPRNIHIYVAPAVILTGVAIALRIRLKRREKEEMKRNILDKISEIAERGG